ncbi:hypothetical protein ACQ9ZF_07730 [Cetobacterium somerae]|uniref:hypothetical protein n=1 Tax=Cetobacterium somerae TaxID=188913 RepID=UPI003D76A153
MFYQIDNFNKRISNADFSFDSNTSLNKSERAFLNYILKHFLKTDDLKVQVPTQDLLDFLKLEIKETKLFLERLSKKTLPYSFYDSQDEIIGSFNLINSYLISEEKVYINLPKEIKCSKAIKILYSFSYKPTYKFYCFFIKNFILKQNFKVKLEDFKLILNSDTKYERFFDFEKNVLKPLMKDLELSYKIKYEKIKIGSNLNNKVVAIDFLFESDALDVTEDIKLKSILFMIKSDIQDVAEVYSILKDGIQNHGYEIAYKTCFKVKQLYKKSQLSFDEVLKASFKKLDFKDVEPNIFIKKVFSSPKELKKCFIYELEKIKPGVILDTSFFSEKFLQDLFLLNDDKTLYFKNSDFSIFINWQNNKESIIKIYLL